MNAIKILYRCLMCCCLFMGAQEICAQQTGDQFNSRYQDKSVQHKYAKWHDFRGRISDAAKNMDTFDDDIPWFEGPTSSNIQATHTYMDTIYVHKGSTVRLSLPEKLNGASSVQSYQRWYNFRTDGSFKTEAKSGSVVDLLTPPSGTEKGYRFKNGYVGKPLTKNNLMEMDFYIPTQKQFESWYTNLGQSDNNYYLVACDVSGYTDYSQKYSEGKKNFIDDGCFEPTLAHRVIFYLVVVDDRKGENATSMWQQGMGRLTSTEYQGGGVNKKYLEEYNISFPYTRISDHSLELVALSKDAQSYAIPGVPRDSENLSVELVDDKQKPSGIQLETTSLEGMNRVIKFRYPKKNKNDNTEYVNGNGTKATILVTKKVGGTTYNLARYNLTFVRDTRLLTQTQLKQIEDGSIGDENLKFYQFRTDTYLSNHYDLLTRLNFDYDQAIGEENNGYYPFPITWNASSYAFYDGSTNKDYTGNHTYPEWSYYALMNHFISRETSDPKPLPQSSYHMYIDASDRPGVIGRLPFREKLCAGSEMFVTAWVKSATNNPAGSDDDYCDPGMLFSVMGVKKGTDGRDIYIPVYRHASSRIRRTDFLTGDMPGTGDGHNEWLQMYFSFILDKTADFDSYVLQVENNSESTKGGDMYLDDIRVYLARPSAKVTQLEATCTNERTLMSMEMDWKRLLSRLGDIEGSDKTDAIDFCFIDKAKYNSHLKEKPKDYEGAIRASVVEIGNNKEGEGGYNQKYSTLHFKLKFEDNMEYKDEMHPNLAINNGDGQGNYYFYRKTDKADIKSLLVDFYSALTPNRSYIMLLQIHEDGKTPDATSFAEDINDPCGINTEFYVTAQTLLRVNGEVVDPSTDFCAGQIFKFSAQMRVPVSEPDGTESYITIDKGVYFDWFFGSEEEYISPNSKYGNTSLLEALTTFREAYPDKLDLDGVEPGEHQAQDGTNKVTLTQNQINLIKHYLDAAGPEGGLHRRLVLHKENLDITLLNDGLKLVLQPIPTLKAPDGNISDSLWAKVCWSYVPLVLHVSGKAPQLHAGFNVVQYPTSDFNPALRIGLSQINQISSAEPLKVNLRGAQLVSEKADYIGKITSVTPDVYEKIYLIATDDPAYKDYFPEDFSEYSLPVGVVQSLHAEPYLAGSSFEDYMQIYFDTQTKQENGFRFQPKEGYSYTLAFHFEEHSSKPNETAGNACFGVFNVVMKVVPEYMVWKGTDTGNWNCDDNWKRADLSDLHKHSGDSYPSNEANTTDKGFVPMLFSRIIIPENSKVELYMAGYGNGGASWDSNKRPPYMQEPTQDIQYDLMTYDPETEESPFTTKRYRVNMCREIHFEHNAEMLHAEQLMYDKAWTDIPLKPNGWQGVSMPLQGVVAGDWYTRPSGKQDTEYFKDMTFDQKDYNRLNPAVYQRSWSTAAEILEDQQSGVSVSFGKTTWSAAYNDAAVPYTAGAGFSVKAVVPVKDAQQPESLLFRFPKADESYDVASSPSLERTNAGRLLITGLVNRDDPYNYNPQPDVTVSLHPSSDGKYLMVGNPFMTQLKVRDFVEKNHEVLAQKYWYIDAQGETQTEAKTADNSGWTGPEGYLAAPYTAFYVELLNGNPQSDAVEVKFTADMQYSQQTETNTPENPAALQITAQSEAGSSCASLRYDAQAQNAYGVEDVRMITDMSGNSMAAPLVYTVAGDRAVSVNQLHSVRQIPLGVFAASDSAPVTLQFNGVACMENPRLYDAETNRETPLTEGYSMTLTGSSHGRYFIRTDGAATTGIADAAEGRNEVMVYSVRPGEVVVSSDTALGTVQVYQTDGHLIAQQHAGEATVCRLSGLSRGIVVVVIARQEQKESKKIMVK